MSVSRHIFHFAFPALLCGVFSLAAGPFVAEANAAGIAGVFDAGWTTAYQSQDSITHMHRRLHALADSARISAQPKCEKVREIRQKLPKIGYLF